MLKKLTQKRNKKGFTLVELIVVIAILGILAAIAVPRLSGFRSTASESADLATAETIEKAIELAIASGRLGDGTVIATANNTTNIIDFSGTAKGAVEAETAKAVMEDLVGTKAKFQGDKKVYTWTIKDLKAGDPAKS